MDINTNIEKIMTIRFENERKFDEEVNHFLQNNWVIVKIGTMTTSRTEYSADKFYATLAKLKRKEIK